MSNSGNNFEKKIDRKKSERQEKGGTIFNQSIDKFRMPVAQ